MRALPALRLALLALLLATLPSCNDLGPSTPQGRGSISVELMSPNGAEGSALFELTGGTGLGVVSSAGGEVYYEHNYGSGVTRVVVVMDVPGHIQFQVRSSNVGDLPSVTLRQVASGDDQLRSSLGGYDLEVIAVADGGVS